MKWIMTMLLVVAFVYMAVLPVAASDEIVTPAPEQPTEASVVNDSVAIESGKLVIDAGLIEWGGDYLTATDGFILRFGRATASGDTMVYDVNTGRYRLDQAAFTACVKPQPHYRVLAKHVELVPGEYVAFSNVQIQIGRVRIPFLPHLVLLYQDGGYRFPDWLPELTFSEEGLGLKVKAEYLPNLTTSVRGAVEVTTQGGINMEGEGQIQLTEDIVLGADLEYDDYWMGGVELNWREDWITAVRIDSMGGIVNPQFTVQLTERNVAGISYNFLAGVTLATENDSKERHNKMYVQNRVHDRYTVGKLGLAWSLKGTPIWVVGYQAGMESKLALQMDARFNDQWVGQLGYGRTDHWGDLPASFYITQPEEYIEAGFGFHWRNQFDEGWDIEALAQYSLVNQRLNFGKTKFIKAYDCFDVELNVEWVKPQATIGFKLKY